MKPAIKDIVYYVGSIFEPYYHEYFVNGMAQDTAPGDISIIAYRCNGTPFSTAEITQAQDSTTAYFIKWPDGITEQGVYRYEEKRNGILICIGKLIVVNTVKCKLCQTT